MPQSKHTKYKIFTHTTQFNLTHKIFNKNHTTNQIFITFAPENRYANFPPAKILTITNHPQSAQE